MKYTIAVPGVNEFEFLTAVLTTWDTSDNGVLRKRSALDQLLFRSEIDGYKKEHADKDCLLWSKNGSDLAVFITRIKPGLYDVEVHAHNLCVKALNIEEL